MAQGMISVKLVDRNDDEDELGKPINLKELTRTGRQMVREDLEGYLEKLDLLDNVEDSKE